MPNWKGLSDIRREYGDLSLSEGDVNASPFVQFECWFAEILTSEKSDPTAMVLSTVDQSGHPDSRVVLLKEIHENTFIFYTNYQSTKSIQMTANPYVALNFYWPETARQVRIRGHVRQTSIEQSDKYFLSRPKSSQLGAIVSPQSREISSRAELERAFKALIEKHQQELVMRPEHWGGYAVTPYDIEFWQGRDNRLHDRIHYYLQNGQWLHRRLAP